jgi:predicted phage baseplate assembly protein
MAIEVGRTIQQNAFAAGSVIRPAEIDIGRDIILVDGQGQNLQGSVQAPSLFDPPNPVEGAFGHLVVPLQVETLSLAIASAVLLGNVARASQGQTVTGEVVGSGDASATFQSFTLQRQPLTYVPSSAPGGVNSTLRLFVNQLQWTEVPELFGQSPAAQVFSTRTTENGKTLIQAGGSTFGAPFPTGSGNITATYRVGAGSAGRVGAASLTTLLDRLQGLSSVTNPLPADGGADPETPDTIRRNAPRTVRTFDRAVSLQDFQDLVTESGEVAKALATWVWDGYAPAVHLTVAGVDGGTFSDLTSLGATLANARDPNHRLLIDNYTKVPVVLEAKVWVDPARLQSDVAAGARDAVLNALSFDALRLAEPLHLSMIYAELQRAPGIVAADVTRFGFKNASISFLQSRGATFLPNGGVAPVQDFLRIFAARPDTSRPGKVIPAELAWIETPSQDVLITVQGN